jgi:hypothetical protein
MKRALLAILAPIVLAGSVVALSTTPASAVPPRDCAFSHYHSALTYYNGLVWSDNQNAWMTPPYRAGACGKAYVEFLGVYNAPSCAYMRLVTYNVDRTTNWVGPWYRFEGVGDLHNIRGSGYLSNGRLYRVYSYGCGRFRHINFPPGMMIFTHAV